MFSKIFSTLSFKKSPAGTTQPISQQAKPGEPTAKPVKKPSVLGRVLKALRSPLPKPRHRKYPPIVPPPLECFYIPREGFDPNQPYPTLRLGDFPLAAPTLPSSTFTSASSSLLPPPPHSTITTPTTVHSEHLPPIDHPASRRDSRAEARQLAIDRLVEALEGHQEAQALRRSEADRLWDFEEANALAKEEEEEEEEEAEEEVAKRRVKRSDLQVRSDYMLSDDRVQVRLQAEKRLRRTSSNGRDPVYRAADLSPTSESGDCVPVSVRSVCVATRPGLAVDRHSTRERDSDSDSYEGPFSFESPPSRQRLLAGRGDFSSHNEGSLGERDEDGDSYEEPFSLESPATRQRYLDLSSELPYLPI